GLLARQHLLPLWLTLASATAGSGILDHLLFVAGRRFRSHRYVVRVSEQAAFARALRFIERFPITYILVFRFIFGLRLASPIAIGVSQVPTWRFTVLNLLGAAIWAAACPAKSGCWATRARASRASSPPEVSWNLPPPCML
ncbi:MAG: DedA family protein, partial [Phenylobacterium sp.]|nr:DedA family protein [Phenylobacterium sp.]